ncbi:MAG: acetyl-CoA carboxylase carboxyltransferase subunit alpha [Sphingomonadales bacterium]|nr:acetyl-CoA carboxylase carboxyltransferase subunit alpha [Sphingomonadales bacterium]MDE2567396.1 acetyl-CoA carboxylase carboxyltransferase subunit alpha [Sphingomonadales bacterium]
MISYLEFEKPVAALEARIAELRETAESGEVDIAAEIKRLEAKSATMLASTYASLSPWQKTQVARHPARPHFCDYVERVFADFMPLGGDRLFGEDQAIIGGFAKLGDRRVMLIGHEKGHDTQTRLRHNFGMGKPEGYRKAVRLMELASRFGLPVVTLVDTSGAFPGVEAEERGQAEAIARSTEACLALGVPMVATIVGEGGSGGAVALASAERVLMLEHAVYAVISPEGCASILWRTSEKAPEAAEAMKVTAQDLLSLGVIDRIVPEPVGGAHRDPARMAASLGKAIGEELKALSKKTPAELRELRAQRFLRIGA